jgi:hypothetical protein
MNVELRNKLVEKLRGREPLQLVSLEDFFTGNDDEGSIGCNLTMHPGVDVFYETLRQIRARPNVQDVLIEITDLQEDDLTTWPFSDTVYILADATESQVEEWLQRLSPDESPEAGVDESASTGVKLQLGIKVFIAWWD